MISIPLFERNFVDLLQNRRCRFLGRLWAPGTAFIILSAFFKDDSGILHDDPAFSVDTKDKVVVITLEQNCSRRQSI